MTLGVYISPFNERVIMSDAVVTYEGRNLTLPPITYDLDHVDSYEQTILFRKNIIMNRYSAITFAGDGEPITRFIEDNLPLIDALCAMERPIRILGDAANWSALRKLVQF